MTHARRLARYVLVATLLAGSSLAAAPVHAAAPHFAALLADGTYLADGRVTEWHDDKAQPKLNGQPLFDPARPVLFLRNTNVSGDAEPGAFVDMFGGDRFVGVVTGFTSGEQSFYRREHEEMMATPSIDVSLPETPRETEMRLVARWAKRIVWQRRFKARYAPSTLFYRDGREVSFRRVRFTPHGVLLLLDAGLVEVSIDDIAELHMPRIDPWDACFEQLASLGAADARLVRLETDEGLRITTSTARFRSRHWGDANDPDNWYRLVQPTWCRTPLAVPQRRVHTMRWSASDEVPLSMIEPNAVEQKSPIGGGWTARIDRSVRDAPLSTGGRESAWGIGMHAECRMTFPLHESVRSFRSAVGLDQSVGRGGCARAEVYVDAVGSKPLFRSDLLIGSRHRVDTGTLNLDGSPGKSPDQRRRLILVADAAEDDRPADADPFDIRDHVDWCEPTLVLDRAKLASAVAARASALLPAWKDWHVAVDGDALPLADRWDERQADGRRYVCEVSGQPPLALSRTMRVEGEHRYLMLCVEQTVAEGKANEISISVDGKPYAAFDVPKAAWNGDDPTPRLIPIGDLRGREVNFRIAQSAGSEKNRVAWRRIALVAQPTNTNWTVLAPRSVESADGAHLSVLPDGSVLASGRDVDRDRYTIELETKLRGITAIRVETLLDETLPRGGSGRAGDGRFQITEARLAARDFNAATHASNNANASDKSNSTQVPIAAASADYYETRFEPANAIDGKDDTGWTPGAGTGKPHAIVFSLAADPTSADGTIFTLTLDQRSGQRQTLGRFRISATTEALPGEAEQVGRHIAPLAESSSESPSRPRMLFDDDAKFVASLTVGEGKATRETGDRFTGGASLRLSRGAAENPAIDQWNAAIRSNPTAGEYRYLRFAWRKRGGGGAILQFADGGVWQSKATGVERHLRYVGGMAGDDGGIVVQSKLPDDWTVVTRDLYADFGPIALTGMRLICPDGEYVQLDSVQLARSLDDFARPRP
ncbi:MAG: NPCBM/NEW2 domain-containing protein [Pirellulales bacterium]